MVAAGMGHHRARQAAQVGMSQGPRRVLVVSYFFPPFRTVGGLRISKHTKFLPGFGWDPVVLTADWNDGPPDMPVYVPESSVARVAPAFDIAAVPRRLLGGRGLPARSDNARIRRRRLSLLEAVYRQVVCMPDAQIGWRAPAVARGLQLIEQFRPALIFSSSLPNTSHLVAASLSRASGLPWVAEMRDLWTENHNFRRFQPVRMLEHRWEQKVLRRATALVTVSEPWAVRLRDSIGRPAHVVPNGFDPDDYPPPAEPEPKRFTLRFTGMIYPGRQSPGALFAAIRQLAETGAVTPDDFAVSFTGPGLDPIAADIREAGIGGFASVHPPVPHREALALQQSATALVFLDWLRPEGRGWHSAKIYEYAGAGRPVLSIGPSDSAVASLIARTGIGRAASTPEQVAGVLRGWLDQWRRTGTLRYEADPEARHGLERRTAVRTLAALFDVVAPAPGAPAPTIR